jgi:hypothetical protein
MSFFIEKNIDFNLYANTIQYRTHFFAKSINIIKYVQLQLNNIQIQILIRDKN